MNESSVSRKRFAHGLADSNLPTMVVRVNEVFEAAQAYRLTADAGAVHVGVAVLQHLPRILERMDDGGLVGAVCFKEQCYWMHRYDYGSAGTLEVLDGNGGQAVAIYELPPILRQVPGKNKMIFVGQIPTLLTTL